MEGTQSFRANVGIVVLNDKWEVLALERIDKKALEKGLKRGTGQWQLPQGGLDVGEEPENAYLRELWEEIQVKKKDIEPIGHYPEWLTYELPKKARKKKHGRGQAQKWFFVRLSKPAKIKLEPKDSNMEQEFFDYKWLPLGSLAEETWAVRRPIYLKLALHLDELRPRENQV